MNYDPQMYNQSRMYVNGVWQNVFRQYCQQMTQGEAGIINNRFNNEIDGLTSSILNMQMQRGGMPLSEQEVYQWLVNWLTQTLQRIRTSNGMGYYGSGMPNNGMGMNMGMGMSMNPGMGFNPGMGMNRPMGGFGGGMPMNNMGYGNMYGQPYGRPQPPQPVAGAQTNMPSATTMQMANAYGMKAPQPPMPQQPAPQQHVATNMPAQKVTSNIVPYREPETKQATAADASTVLCDAQGTKTEMVNEENKTMSVYDLTFNRPVKNGHAIIADVVDTVDPTFLNASYKTYEIVPIAFNTLSKAMFEVKDVIQKALDAEQEYTYLAILNNAMQTLSNKIRGVGDYIESLVVNMFSKYAYTMFLGNGQINVNNLNDLVNLEANVKDAKLLNQIDVIAENIVNMLKDTTVMDICSKDMLDLVGDQIIKGKSVKSISTDEEAFKKLKSSYSVVINAAKRTIWTKLTFNDMVQPTADGCSVTTECMTLDNSPSDNDLEYLLKFNSVEGRIANVIMNTNNVAVNYLVVWCDDNVYMRPAGLY